MKFAIVVLVLLPLAMSASIDEKRFIEGLLGGVDIKDLAQQVITQFSTDESEQQCESTACPQLVGTLVFHNQLLEPLICGAVCKEVQILAQVLPH